MVCHFVDVWLSICLFLHWPPLLEWLKTNWTWPFSQGIPSVFPPCFWWRHQEWHGAVQISRHPIDDLDPISFVWCFIYIYSGPRHENKGLLVWLEVIFIECQTYSTFLPPRFSTYGRITHVYVRHGCDTGLVGWIFPSFPIQASIYV